MAAGDIYCDSGIFPAAARACHQMTYDTQQFYNTALAIIAGSGAAALTDGVGHSASRLALHGSGLELLRHGAENSIRLLPRLVMRKPLEVTLVFAAPFVDDPKRRPYVRVAKSG